MKTTKRMELRRDVPHAGSSKYVTYREVWNMHARPAIRHLITSNNIELYLSACTLTVPWMDRCFTICKFGYDKARKEPESLMRKYSANDIVEFIFYHDSEERPEHIRDVCRHLAKVANSLKHDGYLRKGYGFDSSIDKLIVPLRFKNDFIRFAKFTSTSPTTVTIQLVAVSPKVWVNRAVERIDQLFMDAKILN